MLPGCIQRFIMLNWYRHKTTLREEKSVKKIACFLALAILLCGALPPALADGADQEQKRLEGTYNADELGYFSGYQTYGLSSNDVIIDRNMDVVYASAEGEDILIYANGYFLSRVGETVYLKQVDGAVVFSTESLGVSGFGLLENTEKDRQFLADGYVLAYQIQESITGVSYAVGFLDVTGQWILPLSASCGILAPGVELSSRDFEENLIYAGGGNLIVQDRDQEYHYYLYSILTDQASTLQPDGKASQLDYMITNASFSGGVSYDTYSGTMYEIHPDGTVRVYSTFPSDMSLSERHGSIVGEDGIVISLVEEIHGTPMVVDSTGAVLCELTNIHIVDCVQLDDGWMITADNSEGSVYYTAVGLDGSFLFEPVKTDAVFICLDDGRELMCSDDVGQPHGQKIVIDRNGQVLFTSQFEDTDIFVSNRVVLEQRKYSNELEQYTALPSA